MPQAPQNYKNHARIQPVFHFFIIPVLLLNIVNDARLLWRTPNLGGAFELILALALLMLALVLRVTALTVQDRVIRLEMRLRLREVLPADLGNRIHELTSAQLVALRFASDAELPDLVRDVLAGHLPTQKAIKLRVKDWQADYLRA